MKLNVYTIFDTASGTYWKPLMAKSDGEIMRSFKDISCDAEHPVGQHPEDYSLWRIASWCDNTAKYILEDKECLATALEVVARSRTVDREKMEELKAVSAGGTA